MPSTVEGLTSAGQGTLLWRPQLLLWGGCGAGYLLEEDLSKLRPEGGSLVKEKSWAEMHARPGAKHRQLWCPLSTLDSAPYTMEGTQPGSTVDKLSFRLHCLTTALCPLSQNEEVALC